VDQSARRERASSWRSGYSAPRFSPLASSAGGSVAVGSLHDLPRSAEPADPAHGLHTERRIRATCLTGQESLLVFRVARNGCPGTESSRC
jgi:hypothetical protein